MKKLLPAILAVLIIAGGAFGAWYWSTHSDRQVASTLGDAAPDADDAPLAQPAPDASGNATYVDSDYGFSLTYPASYKIAKVPGDDSDVYLVQNASGTGMQLTVSSYGESGPLTEARIKQDLPDMPITGARQVTLPSGISAVAFNSSGGGFGDSVEVWFAQNGELYQASTYAAQAQFLQQVMGTFRL